MYPNYKLKWHDLTVIKPVSATNPLAVKPALMFSDAVRNAVDLASSHVSVSHDGEYVIAQVVFEQN
jgi:phosphopantetheinyl transferase (holo-ACP synthase)